MAAVCQTCGVVGYKECLVFCSQCKNTAEHRYCMYVVPDTDEDEIIWSCQECLLPFHMKEEFLTTASVSLKKQQRDFSYKSLEFLDEKRILNSVDEIEMLNEKHVTQFIIDSSFSSEEMKCNEVRQISGNQDDRVAYSEPVVEGNDQVLETDKNHGTQKVANLEALAAVENGLALETNEVSEMRESCDIPRVVCSEELAVVENGQVCETRDIHEISEYKSYVYSEPIGDSVWGGCFTIGRYNYGRIAAHLSSKACFRVYEEASKLAEMLCLEKLSRVKSWPSRFSVSPPTDDDIALYFLPERHRDGIVYGKLVNEVNQEDLMFRAVLDSAELLIFSSLLLPKDYWRFQGRCYLWGVFRGRQCSLPR